ncbi:MAG: ABC transporter ATP-binding protein [Armatimonadetes bacterium]|nr:ABC transporter ATP-binding protein [Armatimonadota bacterium]
METVIDVQHLTKIFDGNPAVADVSFSVTRGEVVGFLGPNGAGKTTTIGMLLGVVSPTSGAIRVLDRPMPRFRREVLARVNFSSPYVSLPNNLSVRENLTVFSHLYHVTDPPRRIRELAALFGIEPYLDRITRALSSGEVARVNLAKAFLNDPEILFLDEPTAALDPDAADQVRTQLRRMQRERRLTIFCTSHNMLEVERLATRVIFVHRGRILADGPPRDIVAARGKASLEEFFVSLARETSDGAAS